MRLLCYRGIPEWGMRAFPGCLLASQKAETEVTVVMPRLRYHHAISRRLRIVPAFALLLFGCLTAADAHAQGGTISAQNCGTNFNLASLPPDKKVPLIFDGASGVTQGIYVNTVKDKKVVVYDSCFVDPAGAGIFMASAAKPLPASPCKVLVRRTGKVPSLVEMPITCSTRGVWYDATVVDEAKVLDVDGKVAPWGFAKPKSGALKAIEIASKSMKANKALAAANEGKIAEGQISLPDLGGAIEVLFISKLGSAMPYLVVSPDQFRKLAALLSPADTAALVQRIAR